MTKTISELNTKSWYRLIKAVYMVMLSLVLLLPNFVIFSNGIKELDLNRSTLNCHFAPKYKEANLAETGIYFGNLYLDNFEYKDFYTSPFNRDIVDSILAYCTGFTPITPYDKVGLEKQQGLFDLASTMGTTTFEVEMNQSNLKISDFLQAVTYQNHQFDIKLVYTYVPFIMSFIVWNFAIILFFELLRRAFYYVVLGSVRPPK
jgi:hypothetical protein